MFFTSAAKFMGWRVCFQEREHCNTLHFGCNYRLLLINLEAGTIKQWPRQFLGFKGGILCHQEVEKRQFLIKWCHFCFKCLIRFQSACRKLVSSHCWSSGVVNQAGSLLNSCPNIRYAASVHIEGRVDVRVHTAARPQNQAVHRSFSRM